MSAVQHAANMEKKWYIVHAYSNFERKVAEFDQGEGPRRRA